MHEFFGKVAVFSLLGFAVLSIFIQKSDKRFKTGYKGNAQEPEFVKKGRTFLSTILIVSAVGWFFTSGNSGTGDKVTQAQQVPINTQPAKSDTLVVQNQPNAHVEPISSTPPTPASTIEQSGICSGLDLAIDADQHQCLDRKFIVADKELNEIYSSLMGTLDEEHKLVLKDEEVKWIKIKEEKCAQAGREFEGGTMESVAIADCNLQLTTQRISFLKDYHLVKN